MPKPGKQPFNPFAAAKAVVSSATRQVVDKVSPANSATATGMAAPASGNKPDRPALPPRLRGVSVLVSQDSLSQITMRRASAISAILHLVTPFALGVLALLLVLILSWLWHFNFWDLFKHKTPQDMTFTLVEDSHVKRPEHPIFKGNANQQAGGKQEHKQPLNPAKEKAVTPPSKEGKPAPSPKPQPKPVQPPKQAVAPKPEVRPAAEPPKPQVSKKAEPPQKTSAIGKPAKKEKPTPPKQEPAKPKAQTPKAAQPNNAPEPMQVSTMSTDFGISTTPPGSSASGNPQDGKAKNAGVDVAQDVDYGPFMADLQRRIRRNWIPPRGMESRKLVLMFYVQRDGKVVKVDVEKSSGDAEADRSAIEAVQVSAPFMALPPQFKEDVLPVEFTFDYNVLNPKNAKKALKW